MIPPQNTTQRFVQLAGGEHLLRVQFSQLLEHTSCFENGQHCRLNRSTEGRASFILRICFSDAEQRAWAVNASQPFQDEIEELEKFRPFSPLLSNLYKSWHSNEALFLCLLLDQMEHLRQINGSLVDRILERSPRSNCISMTFFCGRVLYQQRQFRPRWASIR